MPAYSTLSLCTKAEIEAEVRGLDAYTQGPSNEVSQIVEKAIAWAKETIRIKLLPRVTDIFSNSHFTGTFDAFMLANGWTLDQLDNALDVINNPTELKRTAIAYAMVNLIQGQIQQYRAGKSAEYEQLVIERDHWTKEAKSRLEDALRLLKFDLSEDETITADERVRSHTTFHVV